MRVLTAKFSLSSRGPEADPQPPRGIITCTSPPIVWRRQKLDACPRLRRAMCTYHHTPSKKISGNDVSKGTTVFAVVFLSVLTAGFVTGIKRPQTRGQRHVNISNNSTLPSSPLPELCNGWWVFRLNN
ncbi:hypothetical protein QTP88_021574 [Uroleucon formosanum]